MAKKRKEARTEGNELWTVARELSEASVGNLNTTCAHQLQNQKGNKQTRTEREQKTPNKNTSNPNLAG